MKLKKSFCRGVFVFAACCLLSFSVGCNKNKKDEKVDVIRYSENSEDYIASALSPAKILSVAADDASKTCVVVVSDDQLSLAIGKEGQNARLAAKLTGYKIDIKPLSKVGE